MAYRSSTERRRSALVFALCLLGTGLAHAAPPDDAEAELRRGVALRRAGNEAEALEAFQSALALSPSPRALAQVGLAEQALSLWLAAERDLDAALAAGDDAWIRQNREVLEGAKRVVEGRLAWLTVHTNVPASIAWNGTPALPAADGRVRLVAGQVVVEVRAEGYAPFTKTLQIAPETARSIDVELVAVARAARSLAPLPAARSDHRARRVAGWVVAGGGVLALGVGSVFGVRAITKKSERDDDCAGGCTQAGLDADAAGRSAGLVASVAMLAGAATTVTGLALVLTAPAASSRPAAALRVHVFGPSAALSGSF